MTEPTDRVAVVYGAIDAFQRTHRLPGLQHAQIRGLLAEYLARVLPLAVPAVPAPDTDRECAASISGHCLAEGQSETACDTDAGECVHGGKPATDQAALRDRIAGAARTVRLRLGPNALAMAQRGEPIILNLNEADDLADAVLAVLPAPADRAAVLRELADQQEATAATDVIRKRRSIATARRLFAVELRRMADETQQPDTPAEDPARIDRIRPEFTEHSSVESIDAQLQRARSQQRRWHLRAEWLISLRQRRVEQKARGEWPAAAQQPKEARP